MHRGASSVDQPNLTVSPPLSMIRVRVGVIDGGTGAIACFLGGDEDFFAPAFFLAGGDDEVPFVSVDDFDLGVVVRRLFFG